MHKQQLEALAKHILEIVQEATNVNKAMMPSELTRWGKVLLKIEETNKELFLELWKEIFDEYK